MSMIVTVFFCPDLRLYNYEARDTEDSNNNTELKFDSYGLEDALVAQIASGGEEEVQARSLANITGLARINPHKIVRYEVSSNEVKVIEPEAHWKARDRERLLAEKLK